MGKGVTIGLSNLVYALLTAETTSAVPTYGTPVKIAGAISANVNPNASNDTLFADDGPYDVASTVGQISVELNMADLELDVQAALLGHGLDDNKALIKKSTDVPPWVAIGFKSLKSNGKYRYTWLYKGKFATPEQANQTKGDSTNWSTPTLSGSFVKRDFDDAFEVHIDEDTTGVLQADCDSFLTAVYVPGVIV